jgi:hypothetical protein
LYIFDPRIRKGTSAHRKRQGSILASRQQLERLLNLVAANMNQPGQLHEILGQIVCSALSKHPWSVQMSRGIGPWQTLVALKTSYDLVLPRTVANAYIQSTSLGNRCLTPTTTRSLAAPFIPLTHSVSDQPGTAFLCKPLIRVIAVIIEPLATA